jgi:glucose-1-phosphate thymidylyltransferase
LPDKTIDRASRARPSQAKAVYETGAPAAIDIRPLMEVIGLIPAAGRAVRLGTTPCSKEILPVGVRTTSTGKRRIAVLGEYLLDEFLRAGIRQVCVVVDPAKTDIAEYFGNGERYGLGLTYVHVESPSTAFSVDAAYRLTVGRACALGFPDILYPPCDPYSKMLAVLDRARADVVLGLFPTEHPQMMDMVRCDRSGRVDDILVKPESAPPEYTHAWINAIWRPTFTEFLHANLRNLAMADGRDATGRFAREVYLGDVLVAAVAEGMIVEGVAVSHDVPLDAGTPETYALALARFGNLPAELRP